MSKHTVEEKTTDIALISQVQEGKVQAFEDLVKRYKHQVYTLALRVVKNTFDAEEVAQDTFLKAYQALAKFQGKSKFSTWLYRIAYNTALNYIRKHKHLTSELNEITESAMMYNITDFEMQGDQKYFVELGLKSLPQEDALALSLYYLDELSMEEVANIMGQKINTVKVKVHRARKKLAEVLQHILKKETKSLI